MSKDPYASLKHGLVGAWIPSISGSGLLLPDLSMRGNNGSLVNMDASDWVSSGSGRALDFDGVDDVVSCPQVPFTGTGNFSISLWVLQGTIRASDHAIKFGTATLNNAVGIFNSSGNNLAIGLHANAASEASLTANLATNVFYHVVGTCTPTRREIWLNGVSQGTSTATVNYDIGSTFCNIGAAQSTLVPWNGRLDDIRVYSRILSESEIRLLASDRGIGFKRKRSVFSTRYTYQPPKAKVFEGVRVRDHDYSSLRQGLVGAWCPSLPNGGSGNILPDQSGRGNNGTLTNMGPEDWVASGSGRALDFDYVAGSGRQAVELPNSASVRGLATAAISFHCNLQAAPANNSGLFYEATASNGFTKFGIFQTPANALLFVARDTSSGSSFSVTHTPATEQWLHIVGNYNANSDLMELFVNGFSVGTNTSAKGVLVNEIPATTIAAGAYTDSTIAFNYSCNALLDDIRIYNRVLTESEIRLLASKRGIGLQPSPTKFIAKEKKTGLRRRILTGQT